MLYRETIAVWSEIHTKHINTLCGQNVEFVNVKPAGAPDLVERKTTCMAGMSLRTDVSQLQLQWQQTQTLKRKEAV
jgi:hypothetical protein